MSRPAFSFTVPGEPMGKARPRVTKHGTYTPKATRQAEGRIQSALLTVYPAQAALANVDDVHAWRLHLVFSRYERTHRDVDNLQKLVMDAMNGLAYADDSQVETVRLETVWVDRRTDANTFIFLEQMPQEARPPRSKT